MCVRQTHTLEVLRGAHEVRDARNIADILVDPEGVLERRNHKGKTSHALLVGAIQHVLYAGDNKTLHGVANFLSDPVCPFEPDQSASDLSLFDDDDFPLPLPNQLDPRL